MSSEEQDGAEKSYEPTPQRLKKAREDGQVPKSTDLTTAASYLAVVIASFTFGAASLIAVCDVLMGMLADAPRLSSALFDAPSSLLGGLGVAALTPAAIWFVGPMILVLLALIGQQAIVVTPKNLMPKMSRISILSNAKQKFGRAGLFEFAKSAVKLIAYCVLAWVFLKNHLDQVIVSSLLDPAQITQEMLVMLRELLVYVVILALIIGATDLLWQRAEHMRKNMMTRKDLQDEQKDSEGDPENKQKRRQRAQEIALNSMLADVPKADVVVVNPTHYAVALQWDRLKAEPPRCVAKGVDEIAARIREQAIEHGVPIHSDPPTARAMHASLQVGDLIDPDHFVAVAAAIRFADDMRRKAKR